MDECPLFKSVRFRYSSYIVHRKLRWRLWELNNGVIKMVLDLKGVDFLGFFLSYLERNKKIFKSEIFLITWKCL